MHGLLRSAICTLVLQLSQPSFAAAVYRCEDSNGHLTFTLQSCATNQQSYVQNANNPKPGNGKPIALAKTIKNQPARHPPQAKTQKKPGPVVIGEHQDGCGNQVTGSARRTAMINQQVRSGMPVKDVESALGKPDKVSSQNGQMRYLYRDQDGNTRQVSFDENGCVRSKF